MRCWFCGNKGNLNANCLVKCVQEKMYAKRCKSSKNIAKEVTDRKKGILKLAGRVAAADWRRNEKNKRGRTSSTYQK